MRVEARADHGAGMVTASARWSVSLVVCHHLGSFPQRPAFPAQLSVMRAVLTCPENTWHRGVYRSPVCWSWQTAWRWEKVPLSTSCPVSLTWLPAHPTCCQLHRAPHHSIVLDASSASSASALEIGAWTGHCPKHLDLCCPLRGSLQCSILSCTAACRLFLCRW